jgi:hypothetical protein
MFSSTTEHPLIDDLRKLLVPSVIGILFFVFGFFVTAHALDLSMRDMVIGLLAGVGNGITMLIALLYQSRSRSAALPAPSC